MCLAVDRRVKSSQDLEKIALGGRRSCDDYERDQQLAAPGPPEHPEDVRIFRRLEAALHRH